MVRELLQYGSRIENEDMEPPSHIYFFLLDNCALVVLPMVADRHATGAYLGAF